MLAPTTERIENALARLSPDDRALLELSLHRGVSDEDIAALLHVHREHVEHRREVALDQLVGDLDSDSRAEVATLVGRRGRANGEGLIEQAPVAPPPPGRRVTDRPPSPKAAQRRRRDAGLVAAAALAAAATAVVIALSAGGEEPVLGPDPDPPPAPAPAPAPSGEEARAALAPVTSSTQARGDVDLRGSTLRLRATGLPAGSYAVWLFDDVSDTRQVARFKGPSASLRAQLPKGFGRYRSIDVSREPSDGNPNHSGASLLRAPLAKLAR
jgi:hypothetical protein